MKVTADDIAQLLASSPPRRVPPHVFRAARGERVPVWAGLFFAVMGLAFGWIFFPWGVEQDWQLDATGRDASGEVVAVNRTTMTVNKRQVMAYRFRFAPGEGGAVQEADCFVSGQPWQVGARVAVRYLPDRPEIARIDGARRSKAGAAAMMIALFPAVGIALVVHFFVARARLRRLLRDGVVREVDVLAVESTAMQANKRTIYRITVSSPQPGGPPLKFRRVDSPEVDRARRAVAEKQPLFALADPRRQQHLVFPEAWIGR